MPGNGRQKAATVGPDPQSSSDPTLQPEPFDLIRLFLPNNMSEVHNGNDQGAAGANANAPANPAAQQKRPEDQLDIIRMLGPPELTPAEQAEYNNTKFPLTHKTAMILDLANPSMIPEWVRFCLNTFQATEVTSEKVKMQKIFSWMTLQTKQALEHLPGAQEGREDADCFLRSLCERFPASLGRPMGSKNTLLQIVQNYAPLGVRDGDRLLGYCLLMEVEANKLLKPPPAIGNTELVSLFLSAFDDELRKAVNRKVQQQVPAFRVEKRRVDDPYLFIEYKEAAEAVARHPPLESLYRTVTSRDGVVFNAETHSRGGVYVPIGGPPVIKEEVPDLSHFFRSPAKPVEVKREASEETERALAANRDQYSVLVKDLGALKATYKEELETLAQMLANIKTGNVQPAQRVQPHTVASGSGNPGNSGPPRGIINTNPNNAQGQRSEMLCFLCREPNHMMQSCPMFLELLGKGWIMRDPQDPKRLKLKDGSPLPNNFGSESRYQKIMKYGQAKGWPEVSTMMNEMIPDNEDYSEQLAGSPAWMVIANLAEMVQGRSSNGVATVYTNESGN